MVTIPVVIRPAGDAHPDIHVVMPVTCSFLLEASKAQGELLFPVRHEVRVAVGYTARSSFTDSRHADGNDDSLCRLLLFHDGFPARDCPYHSCKVRMLQTGRQIGPVSRLEGKQSSSHAMREYSFLSRICLFCLPHAWMKAEKYSNPCRETVRLSGMRERIR